MEFLHFLVNIILEITQVGNKESQISTMVEQIKNSCLCMVSPRFFCLSVPEESIAE